MEFAIVVDMFIFHNRWEYWKQICLLQSK